MRHQKENEVLKQQSRNCEENEQSRKTISNLKVQVEEAKSNMTHLIIQLQENDKEYQEKEREIISL